MPAIVVCAACQTKLKVPENSTAKALKCPKCKGIVPLAPPQEAPPEPPKPKAPPPKEEDEFEVNESVDEKDEELEVNEAADEEEELEVNEAVDEEEETDDEEDEEQTEDEGSALVELGFGKGTNPFKKAKIPDDARKTVEKSFTKKEKALWAGKPEVKIVESKAWIGLVVGPIAILLGLGVCLGSGLGLVIPIEAMFMKVMFIGLGVVVGSVFALVGGLAIVFRKGIGGNLRATYVVTNKRAYVYDGSHQVRAFTPAQLVDMKSVESTQFPGAGDLDFAYDFMGDAGVQVSKESAQKYGAAGGQQSTPVGFLAIDKLELVKQMINEALVEPHLEKIDAKAEAKKKKAKAKKRFKPFGG